MQKKVRSDRPDLGVERREYPRVKTRKKARYRIIDCQRPEKVSRTNLGIVVNISGGGILLGVKDLVTDGLHISYNNDVQEQNWLAIEIDLIPGRPPIRALGKVVWYQKAVESSEYDFDVGVEFRDIREEDRKAVIDFVNRFQGR